ncbi:unnamed protein product [Cercospora beticola]|nr:unnamed protein product [Cercospora beticola]
MRTRKPIGMSLVVLYLADYPCDECQSSAGTHHVRQKRQEIDENGASAAGKEPRYPNARAFDACSLALSVLLLSSSNNSVIAAICDMVIAATSFSRRVLSACEPTRHSSGRPHNKFDVKDSAWEGFASDFVLQNMS